jgi:hypothetical protein
MESQSLGCSSTARCRQLDDVLRLQEAWKGGQQARED